MTNPDRSELVKLLAWGKSRITDEVGVMAQDAYTSIGHYIASDNGWFLQGQSGWNASASMDAAKAAAQADYEARIKSALVEMAAVKGGPEPVAHRKMTREEYNALNLKGWHSVRHDEECDGVTEVSYINQPADARLREALDNSQSLLVMVNHIGPKPELWETEELSTLLVEQITENRKTITAPGATTKSDGGNEQYLHEVADGSWGDPPLIRAAARDRLAAIAAKKSDGSMKCSGFGECAAVKADGVLCPDDTCDYDTGVRNSSPSDPSSTRSDVTVEFGDLVDDLLLVVAEVRRQNWKNGGTHLYDDEDAARKIARALLDQFEIRRKK